MKVMNYLIVTSLVFCLMLIIKVIWTLINNRHYQKREAAIAKLFGNLIFQEMKALYNAMRALNEGGTALDMIPEGYGEFGYDITNPIPVNTVYGNLAYLGRLRTPDNKKVRYNRKGSTSVENIRTPIDVYDIFKGEELIATLFLNPYNKKNSDKAPKGFELADIP